MILKNIYPAIFFNRINRFVWDWQLGQKNIQFHIWDTGRLSELLFSWNEILLQKLPENINRKYLYRLIGVKNIHGNRSLLNSLLHSRLVEEYLKSYGLPYQKEIQIASGSRIDFLIDWKILVEIKGCSLIKWNTGYFPDAPTSRGVKHLQHLIKYLNQWKEAQVWFLLTNKVQFFAPNSQTDPQFALVFKKFLQSGGKIKFLDIKLIFDKNKKQVKVWLEENKKVKIIL